MDFNLVENARIACARKIKILISIYILFILIVLVLSFLIGYPLGLFFAIPMIIFVVPISYSFIGYSFFESERIYYRDIYKAFIVESNMKKLFTDLSYNHNSGIDKNTLDSTGMIITGDILNSSDYLRGKYHGVGFIQADATISEEHQNSDGNSLVDIFVGRWMIFDFPKKFADKIEIVQNGFCAYKIPHSEQDGRPFEEYHVESPTFNKKFKIYAKDGVNVFYILDPALIDRIETLSNSYTGKLLLCFVDNKLYVGLHDYKDYFEPPSSLKKINIDKENEKVNHELRIITDFVDYLKLDKNIFTNH